MIDGVPSAEDLIKMGHAKRITRGASTLIQILPEGHRLLGEKLREAAQRNGHPSAERQTEIFRSTKKNRIRK